MILLDKDYALEKAENQYQLNIIDEQTKIKIVKFINSLPPVQPEITHCRDCKRSSRNRKYGCGLLSRDDDEIVPMFANDFCSHGKRREECVI